MIFWGTILTFLISMLTYMFFPRSDIVQVEQPLAESAVLPFVEQHQAAKNYMAYMMQISRGGSGTNLIAINPPGMHPGLAPHMPTGITQQFGGGNALPMNSTYNSALACVSAAGALISDCPNADKQYIVTMGLPANQGWWDWTQMRPDAWRRAILKLSRGSAECGTLFQKDGAFFTDTSQRLVPVPSVVATGVAGPVLNQDILFCMTPFERPYVQENLALHIDATNNTGTGNANNNSTFNFGTVPFSIYNQNIVSGKPYWEMAEEIELIRWPPSSAPLSTGEITISITTHITNVNPGEHFLWRVETKSLRYQKSGNDLILKLIDYSTTRATATLANYFTNGNIRNVFNVSYAENGSSARLWINGQEMPADAFTVTPIGTTSANILYIQNRTNLVYNIKIYDTVLGGEDLMKNFRVDRKRFGVYYSCSTYRDCGVR